jgi:hypothetical protein
MKRHWTAALAIVAGATIVASGLATAATKAPDAVVPRPAATSPPRAELSQFTCRRALDPPNRSISVESVMRPLTATRSMALRFDLLESPPGATTMRSVVVRAAGLSVWLSPKTPTLGQLPGDIWELDKSVYDLDAPARYQFRVRFRWTGDRGRVIGAAVRLSPTCEQRELRPDLLVKSITVTPIPQQPDGNLYTAVIANAGATGAGPFEVLFTPGDASAPLTDTVNLLKAGQSRIERFVGPVCNPASPPSVTVDATHEVDEADRANDELTAVCPTITSSSATAAG